MIRLGAIRRCDKCGVEYGKSYEGEVNHLHVGRKWGDCDCGGNFIIIKMTEELI